MSFFAKRVLVCVCVCEGRERVCEYMCERKIEGKRESVCVCVFVWDSFGYSLWYN